VSTFSAVNGAAPSALRYWLWKGPERRLRKGLGSRAATERAINRLMGRLQTARPFFRRCGRPFFSYQMCAVAVAPTILVFDSGLGGLTVFREVLKARPDARYVYVADDAFFPYGGHGEAELVARVVALMGDLIEAHRPTSSSSPATPPPPWSSRICARASPFPSSARCRRSSRPARSPSPSG
jgi:hypothetical protein